jgi:hypothetical protein
LWIYFIKSEQKSTGKSGFNLTKEKESGGTHSKILQERYNGLLGGPEREVDTFYLPIAGTPWRPSV